MQVVERVTKEREESKRTNDMGRHRDRQLRREYDRTNRITKGWGQETYTEIKKDRVLQRGRERESDKERQT